MATRPWYATNARELLESRKRGMAPDGPVAVSMIGGTFPAAAATLYVRDDTPLERLDWRMLVNLDVWLWADRSIALSKVHAVLGATARARPKSLFLRFGNPQGIVHDIEVGIGEHLPAVMEFPAVHQFTWCPTNNAASKVGAQLRRSLLAQHPAFTIL